MKDEVIESGLEGFRYYSLLINQGGFIVRIGYRVHLIGITVKEILVADERNAKDYFDVKTNIIRILAGSNFSDFSILHKTDQNKKQLTPLNVIPRGYVSVPYFSFISETK